MFSVITEKADPSLVTQGWVGDKPCLLTVDIAAYVTDQARHRLGWSERQPNQRYMLQTVSGDTLPILKEVFLTLTLGWCPHKIWVFVAIVTNKFILGLDILHAYDASLNLGRQTLCLAEEEVSQWSPEVGHQPSSLVVARDQLIPAQCEGVVMRQLESS
jgi:hypothetical protein